MNRLIIDIKDKSFTKDGANDAFCVIKNLHLELNNNEFVCLVGPSGCGKSTLLNTVAGLDTQFEGTINAGDQHGTLKTSYVFQTPRLLPWRTVLENIQLAAGDETIETSRITHVLERLGIETSLNSYPQHLSLGMQRRVALARAFCIQSHTLLMDEPFVSLDQPTARKARRLLLELWAEHPRNVLFVTHDLNEAIELADRVIFLSDSPSSVIGDFNVDIARDDRTPEQVSQFINQLSANHQNIQHLL
ncbi:MAG: ABC transporter ATP-binding protein [Cycloclasticus sp.]|nr:ABC transporter ATP-binding protein [Cycloclasticus sp.]